MSRALQQVQAVYRNPIYYINILMTFHNYPMRYFSILTTKILSVFAESLMVTKNVVACSWQAV